MPQKGTDVTSPHPGTVPTQTNVPTVTQVPSDARAAVDALRQTVADLHRELTRYGLVIWTAGNVSARVPGHDLMVIKPSGVAYDELTAANMVVTDLFGALVEGSHSPSSDTAAHAYVYRHMPDVGGVVHTHSTYATAWAALAQPILDKTYYPIIDDAFEFAVHIIVYQLHAFFLDGAHTLCFDEDLVHDRDRAQHPPGGAIICCFL